jgi:hypothetical protein
LGLGGVYEAEDFHCEHGFSQELCFSLRKFRFILEYLSLRNFELSVELEKGDAHTLRKLGGSSINASKHLNFSYMNEQITVYMRISSL